MIHPLAIVETDLIGENVTIQEFAIVRPGVVIEDNVVIHPFVVIEAGARVGTGTEIFPGSVIGKVPNGAGATARPLECFGEVVLGAACAVGPNAVVYRDVAVGHNTLIGDGASVREGCRIGDRSIVGRHVTLNYNTRVGSDVKIMDHTWLAGNMQVGDRVFISGGVVTANDNAMGLHGYRADEIVGPRIEDDVSIGAGAILLPGVTIGEAAIVAAGSVVTKDIQPRTRVMGLPARVTDAPLQVKSTVG